jgi:signal peptidase I
MDLNYPLILFVAVVTTGAVWLGDLALLRRRRLAGAAAELARFDRERMTAPAGERERLRARLLRAPTWVEWLAGFFPVLLLVFVLRSFVGEPFRIPSGSMRPTLEVGDFILVNKFAYGIRLPIVDREIVPLGKPQRGDVIVFRYPPDPSQNYVKRVIGLPGDTIAYRDKRVTVNGKPVPITDPSTYFDEERGAAVDLAHESLPSANGIVVHDVLLDPRAGEVTGPMLSYPFRDACRYGGVATITCTVPAGHYFVMGDNRDNSADSRFWGFVPDENLVGRAMFIWMNFGKLSRIGRIGHTD